MSKIGTWAGWTYRISIQTPSALRHDCVSESLVLSVSVIRSWIVVWLSSSFSRNWIFFLFRTFWRLDVVPNKGERKMSHSTRFELALEDPIWFLVRRLNHSAMTAWSSFYFVLSVNVELLCGFYFPRIHVNTVFWQVPIGSKKSSLDRKYPQWGRLEREVDGPI